MNCRADRRGRAAGAQRVAEDVVRSLIASDRFGRLEPLEPSGLPAYPVPAGDIEVDDHEAGRRIFRTQPVKLGPAPLANQLEGQILQAGIVADKQKSFNVGGCFSDDCEDRIGGGFIDARLAPRVEIPCERATHEIPGFLGAARRRNDGEVRDKPFSRDVLAYLGTCLASGFCKWPFMILDAFGAIGFGMAEKHQSLHRPVAALSFLEVHLHPTMSLVRGG
jgi:hypothetical protein